MPFINGGVAISQVRGFRMCWLPGRFGSGKSAVAFRLGYELSMNYGYQIISNTECIWNETTPPDWKFDDAGSMTLDVYAVVDEGGLWLQSEVEAMEYLAFAGKMNLIVVLPSITEPCDIFSSLTIQPMYNFRSIGVPYNVYEWRVSQQKAKFKGGFGWLGMEEIYGTYSTLNPASDPRGILHYLREKVSEYKQYYFERQKIPSWQEEYAVRALAEYEIDKRGKKNARSKVGEHDNNVLSVGAVLEAAKKFERVSNDLETLFERESKGNRRRWGGSR
jgi:hypothetical protein